MGDRCSRLRDSTTTNSSTQQHPQLPPCLSPEGSSARELFIPAVLGHPPVDVLADFTNLLVASRVVTLQSNSTIHLGKNGSLTRESAAGNQR